MLEVEADLIEALFRNEVFTFGPKIAAVDDGIDEVVWMGTQVAAGFDAPDAFEAQGVPDTAGGDVGFVYEVEDGVGVALGSCQITRPAGMFSGGTRLGGIMSCARGR